MPQSANTGFTHTSWSASGPSATGLGCFFDVPTGKKLPCFVFPKLPRDVSRDRQQCAYCRVTRCFNEGVMKTCSGCKKLCYCSSKCQKLHWPQHAKLCKKLRNKKADCSKRQLHASLRAYVASKPLALRMMARSGRFVFRVLDDKDSTVYIAVSACKTNPGPNKFVFDTGEISLTVSGRATCELTSQSSGSLTR